MWTVGKKDGVPIDDKQVVWPTFPVSTFSLAYLQLSSYYLNHQLPICHLPTIILKAKFIYALFLLPGVILGLLMLAQVVWILGHQNLISFIQSSYDYESIIVSRCKCKHKFIKQAANFNTVNRQQVKSYNLLVSQDSTSNSWCEVIEVIEAGISFGSGRQDLYRQPHLQGKRWKNVNTKCYPLHKANDKRFLIKWTIDFNNNVVIAI